jgi:hypothetical protein
MQWELLWKGRCRVYFNAKEDFPLIWSVDDGDVANEYKVRDVCSLGPTWKTQARAIDEPEQPKVWINFINCAVYMNEEREVKITFR